MSKSTMTAAVLEKPQHMVIKDVAMPVPKEDEVLIKVYCIGICGSDVHYYERGKIGRYVVEQPIILGHELAGEIIAIGNQVENVAVGDRVAVEPGVTCGKCSYCKSGRYNLCPEVQFMATPPVDGAWAEYVTIRSDYVFVLPEHMSYEEGALLEPLSVSFHALKRANAQPDQALLITGAGPIGLMAIQAAKLFGIKEIYVSDVVPFRREYALKLGATAVLDPSQGSLKDQIAQLSDHGIDLLLETSGNRHAISETITTVNRGGKIVCIGLPPEEAIPIDINTLIDSELDIYGVFRYANTYQAAIRALHNSGVRLSDTITHQFSLMQIQDALDVSINEKESCIKIMIYPNQKL